MQVPYLLRTYVLFGDVRNPIIWNTNMTFISTLQPEHNGPEFLEEMNVLF